MILFHGSNIEIPVIDLTMCAKYKDFGQGFYMTSIRQQSREWAVKVSRRYNSEHPVINVYEFNENINSLNMLDFTEPDSRWASFVINNRNKEFSNHSDLLSNHDNKYDLVHGFVANDDISAILDTFLMGILPMSEIPNALFYKKLNDQYSFHTSKALSCLTFLRSELI